MKTRENLSGIISSIGKNNSTPSFSSQIGKVFGIITTKNTPNKELYEKYGKENGIGTIFYLDFNSSKNTSLNNVDLKSCKIAKPYNSNVQDYPLVGELVELIDGPSAISQIGNNTSAKYYKSVINIWNNPQQNSLTTDPLGRSFKENADVRNLLYFEGDRIIQGRKGNGIRLGSTARTSLDSNEWSKVGNEGDPIVILVNGYITPDPNKLSPNVEEINKELSSIYMTSTQLVPLIPDRNDTVNPLTQPLPPNKYFGKSQLLLNSDRLVLNSKKDEVMIYAKTNIEINTKNIINLNAGERTHLNSPRNFIGTNKDGTLPTEPLLLGNKTIDLLSELMSSISEFGSDVSSAISAPAGSPIIELNTAGSKLTIAISTLMNKLEKIASQQNYTS